MPNDAFTAGQSLSYVEMNLLPFGYMGGATASAIQAGVGTSPTDITSLTVTFTGLASRRYKITGTLNARKLVGAGIIYMEIVRGSTIIQTISESVAVNDYATLHGVIAEVPGAGSVTYKIRGWVSNDTMDVNPLNTADTMSAIMVEDIGQ